VGISGILEDSEARVTICAYPWPCEWTLGVMQCESGGDWYTWDAATGVTYYGAFQIWIGHGFDLSTPAKQVAAAYALYLSEGPGAWPSCP